MEQLYVSISKEGASSLVVSKAKLLIDDFGQPVLDNNPSSGIIVYGVPVTTASNTSYYTKNTAGSGYDSYLHDKANLNNQMVVPADFDLSACDNYGDFLKSLMPDDTLLYLDPVRLLLARLGVSATAAVIIYEDFKAGAR